MVIQIGFLVIRLLKYLSLSFKKNDTDSSYLKLKLRLGECDQKIKDCDQKKADLEAEYEASMADKEPSVNYLK